MQNKTVHIMDPLEPLPDNACLKGYHQELYLHSTLMLECSISPWHYQILGGAKIFITGSENTLNM